MLGSSEVPRVGWLFDRPVSNSGRIRSLVLQTAAEHAYHWSVDLVDNPDRLLTEFAGDHRHRGQRQDLRVPAWFNLARHVIDTACPGAWIADLGP